ncbi:MAG: YitT family protein [Chlamydiota bacterium]
MITTTPNRTFFHYFKALLFTLIGTMLAGLSIEMIFIPNQLIDGGIVGLSMLCSYLFGQQLLPIFLIIFTLPFLYLAWRHIGKFFLIHMIIAVLCFAGFLTIFHGKAPLQGDLLEIVVLGGVTLGVGLGLIIRMGGCLDGTEILGLIANKKMGFTVGQVVFAINFFVFSIAGLVYGSWHPPLYSLMAYFVAMKVMDTIIVGLEETKSVNIISEKLEPISEAIIKELGLGLTIMYGRGGFSQKQREIIYVVVERLQLAELKEIVYREDPDAFLAIQNLHEVANGRTPRGNLAGFKKP